MYTLYYLYHRFENALMLLAIASIAISIAILQVILFIISFPYVLTGDKIVMRFGNRFIFYAFYVVGFVLNRKWKYVLLSELPKPDYTKKRIYMCNHLSNADPFFLTLLGMNKAATTIYKDELHYIYPRILLKFTGHVPIYFKYDRANRTKTVIKECIPEVMERCRELMEHGFDIFVYPEGTRSKTRKLLPFKDGFFKLALENDCEIIPCVVHNTHTLFSEENFITRGTGYFKVCDPINVKGKSTESLKLEVRLAMYRTLKSLSTFDPEVETVPELEALL